MKLTTCFPMMLAVLLATACSGPSADSSDEATLPVVSGMTSDFIQVQPGNPVTITLSVDASPGVPAQDYLVSWITDVKSQDGEVVVASVGAGREQWTFTPSRVGFYTVKAEVFAHRDADITDDQTPRRSTRTAVIQSFGGDCVSLQFDNPRMELVVGETRSVSVEALADLPSAQVEGYVNSTPSHETVQFSVGDDTLVKLSPEGVVSALAPGDTQITATCSGAQTSLDIHITSGGMQQPGKGFHTLFHRSSNHYGGDLDTNVGSMDGRLSFRANGWPVAVVQPLSGTLQQAQSRHKRLLLAEWTGTGFGYVQLGEPFSSARHPHVLVDEDDAVWVVWQELDLADIKVAYRAPDASPDDFLIRSLPLDQEPVEGQLMAPLDRLQLDWTTGSSLALGTRSGGGVYVAYNVFGPAPGEHATPICANILRLAEVTSGFFATTDLHSAEFPGSVEGFEGCMENLPEYGVQRLVMVPQANGNSVLWSSEEGKAFRQIVRYTLQNGAWEREVLVDPADLSSDDPARLEPIDFVPVVNPASADKTGLIWVSNRQEGKPDIEYHTLDLPQNHYWTGLFPEVEGATQYLFSVFVQGRTYLGDRNAGPWMALTPFGTLQWEDPVWLLDPDAELEEIEALRYYSALSGFAVQDDQVHLVMDNNQRGVDLVILELPRPLTLNGEESDGKRLTEDALTPSIVGAIQVREDRTRHLLVEYADTAGHYVPTDCNALGCVDLPQPAGRAVLKSTGPGDPFLPTDENLEGLNLEQLVAAPFENKGNLYALQAAADHLQLMRFKDGLWSPLLEHSCNGEVLAWAATAGGSLGVICAPTQQGDSRDFQILYATKMLAGVEWMDLGGAPDNYQGPNFTNGTSVALLPDGDQLVAVVLLNGPGGWQVLLRRCGSLGVESEVQSPLDEPIPLHTLALAQDGSLVGMAFRSGSKGYQWFAVRTTDDFANHTWKIFGDGTFTPPAGALSLGSGRLVVPGSRQVSSDVSRAFYVTSDDFGVTWSDPVDIRPDGGGLQKVLQGVQESDYGLLLLLEDNGSTRAWVDNDFAADFPLESISDVSYPRPETGLMKISAP